MIEYDAQSADGESNRIVSDKNKTDTYSMNV